VNLLIIEGKSRPQLEISTHLQWRVLGLCEPLRPGPAGRRGAELAAVGGGRGSGRLARRRLRLQPQVEAPEQLPRPALDSLRVAVEAGGAGRAELAL